MPGGRSGLAAVEPGAGHGRTPERVPLTQCDSFVCKINAIIEVGEQERSLVYTESGPMF